MSGCSDASKYSCNHELIKQLLHDFTHLLKRIEALEEKEQLSTTNTKCNILFDKVNTLESRINQLIIDIQKEHKEDKPYKCPVCDGKGCDQSLAEDKILRIIWCKPCKGTGIIWSGVNE